MIKSIRNSQITAVDVFRGIGIPLGITRWFIGGSTDFIPKDQESRVIKLTSLRNRSYFFRIEQHMEQ